MLRAIAVKSVIIFSVKPANLLCGKFSMDSIMGSDGLRLSLFFRHVFYDFFFFFYIVAD